MPSNPDKQLQVPVLWSQIPALEHSATACATSSADATSTQATSDGHACLEQSAPKYPSVHVHWKMESAVLGKHNPWPEHWFGHSTLTTWANTVVPQLMAKNTVARRIFITTKRPLAHIPSSQRINTLPKERADYFSRKEIVQNRSPGVVRN